jgi:excinuclease ABC subunit C
LERLANKMTEAADNMQFEKAARLRDQLQALQKLQQQQAVHTATDIQADLIAIAAVDNSFCVHALFVRNGRVLGSKTYFPKVMLNETVDSVLVAFLEQFYSSGLGAQAIPDEIITSEATNVETGLLDWLQQQANKKITVKTQVRGVRELWLNMARVNAKQALQSHLASKQSVFERLRHLQEALGLSNLPQLIECFDISHSQGEETVASCVVLDETGMNKKRYRRFNIKGITGGDDYAAMEQVLSRRYRRQKEENQPLPDIILIDGGKGQLSQAEKVMQELMLTDILLVGVAKGATRKPGLEQLWLSGRELPCVLPADHPALLLIQQIRDEAHRFAITGHRNKRDKKRSSSPLESIDGIGPKKRQALLRHFGGWQGIKQASIEELCKVKGISPELAEKILAYEP